MIDSVSDHVEERIFKVLEDASIDLNVGADDFESREFIVTLRNVSYGAGELLEQRTHRHEAHAHHLLLQVLLQALDFAMNLENPSPGVGFEILDHAAQTAVGYGDLSSQVQHAIEFVGVDA